MLIHTGVFFTFIGMRKELRYIKAFCLCMFLLGTQNVAFGQAGELDAGFGDGGVVITSIAPMHDDVTTVAIQPDGKIVSVGRSHASSTDMDGFVTRHLPDGSLDSTFGNNGSLQIDLGSLEEGFGDVTILSSGKILIGGSTMIQSDHAGLLIQLNEDGSYDAGFGNNGVYKESINGSSGLYKIMLLDNGEILTTGHVLTEPSIFKFNADGSLATGFGINGVVSINSQTVSNFGSILKIVKHDGKLLVIGRSGFQNNSDAVIFRFNADGSLDNSFGDSGWITLQIGDQFNILTDIKVLSDAKILVCGNYYDNNSIGHFYLAQLTSDGNLDTSFGSDGVLHFDVSSGNDFCNALILQPDGKILLSGVADSQFYVGRVGSDGTFDPSFGNNGSVFTQVGISDCSINDSRFQADGRILVAGYARTTYRGLALARYESGLNISVNELAQENVLIHPNPTATTATLTLPNAGTFAINVIDAMGREVYNEQGIERSRNAEGSLELNTSQWPQGIYAITATNKEGVRYTGKLVVRR